MSAPEPDGSAPQEVASTIERRLIRASREGFALGETLITREEETTEPVGFDFTIRRMDAGERLDDRSDKESVWILLHGDAEIAFDGGSYRVRRGSLFDEPPTALSASAETPIAIASLRASEWAVARVTNPRRFAPKLFLPAMLVPELRGRGLAQDMSLRNVRLIFDLEARPESNLVLGEVVNYPGRWSSYPPHSHPQPELYHYRFTAPQGYGHAELGDQVMKVRQNDTIKIMGGETHAQVSAPGYGMYYLWIIRHLPGNAYRGFEFAPEHRWLLNPENQGWRPKDGEG